MGSGLVAGEFPSPRITDRIQRKRSSAVFVCDRISLFLKNIPGWSSCHSLPAWFLGGKPPQQIEEIQKLSRRYFVCEKVEIYSLPKVFLRGRPAASLGRIVI